MATDSNIEWTEFTWNPVTGCIKVSQGCKNCYAERMAKRLRAMGARRYSGGFKPMLHWDLNRSAPDLEEVQAGVRQLHE